MNSDALIGSVTTNELVNLLDTNPSLYLIDVREPDEVADWKIEGVHNLPLGSLADRLSEVPRDKDLVVICAKGARALQGAQVLAEAGIASRVLEGGMGAWASTYDLVEGNFDGATVVQVRRRGKGCLSYIIGAGDRAVVIDPSLEVELYERVAREHGWAITYVLDTHLHADHISGARELVSHSGAELLLSPYDPFTYAYSPLEDGKELTLSDDVSLRVSAVSVPGHTEGSTMYQLGDKAIFTGDTLFLESVGRPDLAEKAEEFAGNLYKSLHERVMPLPGAITVFPAHYGPVVPVRAGQFVSAPLGELKEKLEALALSEADFISWALANVKDRPPNYQEIVLVNAGAKPVGDEAIEMELGPNRCAIAS